MSKLNELKTALLELLHATGNADLKIIVGGGYGIFLKREYIGRSGVRTLLGELPEARATNDLDLFLRPELLIDSSRLKPLADAIVELGYVVVSGAEKYQFIKNPDSPRTIKIDLLTGPGSSFLGKGVRVDSRRIQPKPSVGVHAHRTDEALTLEEGLREIEILGTLSNGEEYGRHVYIPNPFTYLMMKLFAFRDRLEDENKDYGSYHALDLYAVLATTTEDEWEEAKALSKKYSEELQVVEARKLVMHHFNSQSSTGMLRLRGSKYFEPRFQVVEFMEVLRELFPEVEG